jgi:hypothetical protein
LYQSLKQTSNLSDPESATLSEQQTKWMADQWRLKQAEDLLIAAGYVKMPDGSFRKPE